MAYVATEAIRLPVDLYLNLEMHLFEERPHVKPDALVTKLVRRWLAQPGRRFSLEVAWMI
jgi:hypothetical protein